MPPSVFIAIPNLGNIRTELALVLFHWLTSGRYRLKIFMPMYIQPHHRARNVCHREFLKENYEWLLFIDSDCAPPADGLERLLLHNVEIVGGVVLTWKDGAPVPVALRRKGEGYAPHYGTGLEEVDVITMAFTLIHRSVLEALPLGSFAWEDCTDGTDGLGEEFVFCERAKEAGFKIFCDYSLLVGHRKEIELLEINRALLRRK